LKNAPKASGILRQNDGAGLCCGFGFELVMDHS
jgi:hypothetical protein